MICGLRIELVNNGIQRELWNTVIQQEHPQGATIFVGAQIKYLIQSDHGLLGAAGFAASALKLSDRDRYLGWNHDKRKADLNRIANLSRYLIRPMVRCRNLASHVLGQNPGSIG